MQLAFPTPRSTECGRPSACSRTAAGTFKLSSDPVFGDKVGDIVGLYLSPPNRAVVLSGDKKIASSQSLVRPANGHAFCALHYRVNFRRHFANTHLGCDLLVHEAARHQRHHLAFAGG